MRNNKKWCFVPKCTNTTTTTPQKMFVTVPKTHPEKRKNWFDAARRDVKTVSPKSTLYCCEDHFDLEKDMENYMEYKMSNVRARMKSNVVPYKFACQHYSALDLSNSEVSFNLSMGKRKTLYYKNPSQTRKRNKKSKSGKLAHKRKRENEREENLFPRVQQKRKLWLCVLGFDNIKSVPSAAHICSEHFNPDDILVNPTGSKKYLKPDAIPLPLPFPDKYESSSSDCDADFAINETPPRKKVLEDKRQAEEEAREPSVPACSLASPNVKLEEFELVETIDSGISNFQNEGQNSVDPLIKIEDEEATCSTTNIAPEPLQLLPETSRKPRIQQTSTKSGRKSKDTIYCRLCLKETNKATQLPLGDLDLNYPDKNDTYKENKRKKIEEVQTMISLCLPFFEPLIFNPVLCQTCLTRLKSCYEFVSQCRENQNLIEKYIEFKGNTEMIANIDDIVDYKFSIQNPKKTNPEKVPNISKSVPKTKIVPSKTYPPSCPKRVAQKVAEPTTAKRKKNDETLNQNSKELLEPVADITIKEEPFLHYQEDIPQDITDTLIKVESEYVDSPNLIKIDPEEGVQTLKMENTVSLREEDRISQNRDTIESVDRDRDRIKENLRLPDQGNISSRKVIPPVLEYNVFCTSDANCICMKCAK